MIEETTALTPRSPAPSQTNPTGTAPEIGFRDVLSAINPLQYLPVVGQIYRAVTGDVVPEPLRVMGSMVASGLMGGPIGVAVSAASSLLQHVAGIDLDSVAHDVMAAVGILDDASGPATQQATVPDAATRQMALTAYGQTLYTYGPGAGHA
jgi:hypothetical protein